MHVLNMGDRLLQRGTVYGAHRMSGGGTIYDNTGGPGAGGTTRVGRQKRKKKGYESH
jgi:hypothetical protein